jgi:3-isopropylmalate/(R)-2-methylmalate dehydratase small subunit
MTPFTKLAARAVVLPADDVDTDQIIPARFLKGTAKVGLAAHLFADWRTQPDFPLLAPSAAGAQILVTGNNFGCGSSREHAPWALTQYGFRAVISTSFADIFRGNALKNSLLPIVIPAEEHKKLLAAVAANPAATVTVDLAQQKLTLPDGSSVTFPVDSFAKECMLQGVDELGYILKQDAAISAFEKKRTLTINTLSAA